MISQKVAIAIIAFGSLFAILLLAAEFKGKSDGFENFEAPSSRELLGRKYPSRGDQGFETTSSYFVSVFLTALAGAIIGSFFYCLGCCFCCGRFCCKCGCCMPGDSMKCSSDSSRQVLAIIISICAGVTFVGVVVGFVGNGIVSEGIRDFINRIVNTVDDIQAKADNITITMEQLDSNYNFSDFRAGIKSVADVASTAQDVVYAVDIARVMVILVAFEVSLVVAALGIVSGLLKKRQSIIGLFVVTFLSVLVMWYSYAIDLPMSILFDDICYTVNDYIDNGVDNSGPLSYFLQCLGSGSWFGAGNNFLSGVTNIFSEVNQTTSQYGIPFSPPYNTSGTLDQQLSNILTAGQSAVSQIEQISQLNATLGAQLAEPLHKLQLTLTLLQEFLDLINCNYLKGFILGLRADLCNTLLGGVMTINAGVLICGITAVPSGFLAFYAINRWDPTPTSTKFKTMTEGGAVVQLTVGMVGIASVGSGAGVGFIIGIILLIFSLFGFLSSMLVHKVMMIIYTVLEFLLLIVDLAIIIFEAYSINNCTGCSLTKKTQDAVGILILLLAILPLLVSVIAARNYLHNFKNIKEEIEMS